MKVGFCDKKLWELYSKYVAVIFGVFSFGLIFVDNPSNRKILFAVVFLGILIFLFLTILLYANKKQKRTIRIGETKFIIKYGDLFSEKGLKTIAFNEYFDTEVDEKIISSNTLNGKFLNKEVGSKISKLDNQIIKELKKKEREINTERISGKKIKYKLGTVIKYDASYVLLAFSKFDEDNAAFLTPLDYFNCLYSYWHEINKIYNGENIVLPLLGSGLTRSLNCLTIQNKLETILRTFQFCDSSFSSDITITIVLPEGLKGNINLFDLNI